MVKQNCKCLACGTKYSYCPTCSRSDSLKPSWYSEFCSETCKDLWFVFTKYNMNRLTKTEAKSIISNLNMKPIDSYVDCIKRDYAKIMTEEKKPKRGKRSEMSIIDEVIDIQKEVVDSVVEELAEIKVEQVIEPVAEETTIHEVVKQENE